MSDLKAGMKVLHPMFGAGTVRAISGSGGDAKITVDFSGSVGQKKLLASVANLTPLGESTSSAPVSTTWFETLEVACEPKSGRRVFAEKSAGEIRNEVRRHDFWIAVRDRMRSRGLAPKVLDDVNGQISISTFGLLKLDIRIRHKEMIRTPDLQLAQSIAELLSERLRSDFEIRIPDARFGISGELVDEDTLNQNEEELTDVPDRAPTRRPLPVTPKGVIKSRPKRRDDY